MEPQVTICCNKREKRCCCLYRVLYTIIGLFAFVIGIFGSFSVATYVNLPLTDELIITEEVFYSYNDTPTATADININDADVTVHFLELGNKYTGDCTYIKATGTDAKTKTTSASTAEVEAYKTLKNKYDSLVGAVAAMLVSIDNEETAKDVQEAIDSIHSSLS